MNHLIHQEIVYDATPARVYSVLTDAGEFSKMSGGAPTEIDARPGGTFSCFGGMILGKNIECNPEELLVQSLARQGLGARCLLNRSIRPTTGGQGNSCRI